MAKEWVIGGSLAGLTNADEDGLLNSQLQDSGLNATASTSKSIRVIWNLFAGYHFTKDWGAEIAYLDLGKVETTFTGTSVDIDTFLNSAQEIHPQTAQGWLLSVNRFFPLDHDTRMKLRAGLYSWTADYTLQGSNTTRLVSESSTDLSYGLSVVFGRCYKKGTLGYISLDQTTVDETDFSVLGFGFSYCFK
ncbi:MAG: hypothetical protein OEY11_11540 [Gammaproteobacteria bacterium]|nr:hypothetical protein [Gammaproteobacteria bacterium]